jgi:hypothetical protein
MYCSHGETREDARLTMRSTSTFPDALFGTLKQLA